MIQKHHFIKIDRADIVSCGWQKWKGFSRRINSDETDTMKSAWSYVCLCVCVCMCLCWMLDTGSRQLKNKKNVIHFTIARRYNRIKYFVFHYSVFDIFLQFLYFSLISVLTNICFCSFLRAKREMQSTLSIERSHSIVAMHNAYNPHTSIHIGSISRWFISRCNHLEIGMPSFDVCSVFGILGVLYILHPITLLNRSNNFNDLC